MVRKHLLMLPGVRSKLRAAQVARMATVCVDGSSPHIVPICFIFDGSVFYSAIDHKPKQVSPNRLVRVRNIKQTPQVALLVDEYDEDWRRLWYVLVRGKAEIVSGLTERKRAIRQLRKKYRQYDKQMLDDAATVLRITPTRITAWGKI